MKDSKDKEHRISNLKNMINNIKEDEINRFEEMEEDSELIDYLKEELVNFDALEIDDEFIYHPGEDDDAYAVNLEETEIDEDFIIKTPKTEEDEENNDEIDEFSEDIVGEISENFDNLINAKIAGKSILAIASTIIGVILLIYSVIIFQSRSDRVIDNVVAGETNFIAVILIIIGLLLVFFGLYKLLNFKNPFSYITSSMENIENDDETADPTEKPSPKVIPKSEIPLDKDAYKIGEFDMDEIKSSLKKPTASKNKQKINEDLDNVPPAKERSVEKEELTEEEIEEMEYEQTKLDSESIDDIFAEVEDLEELPIISIDSEEKEKEK